MILEVTAAIRMMNVMALSGIEFIFFITAPAVLCFGFVTKIVLITHFLAIDEQCLINFMRSTERQRKHICLAWTGMIITHDLASSLVQSSLFMISLYCSRPEMAM